MRKPKKPRALAPATFGRQIRSYTLHPVERVIDHRTGVETADVRAVLDGDLGLFLPLPP